MTISRMKGGRLFIWLDITSNEHEWVPEHDYRVKTCTEKLYMALLKRSGEPAFGFVDSIPDKIKEHANKWGAAIIGDIVEREVEIGND